MASEQSVLFFWRGGALPHLILSSLENKNNNNNNNNKDDGDTHKLFLEGAAAKGIDCCELRMHHV